MKTRNYRTARRILHLTSLFFGLLLLFGTATSLCAAVLIQSIGPQEASITIDNNTGEWGGLTAYQGDGFESLPEDWQSVTIAQDASKFFFRYGLNSNQTGYDAGGQTGAGALVGNFNLVLDTDQSRSSGWIGTGGAYGIGAEYLLSGASLYQYSGTGEDYSWTFVSSINASDNNIWDYELEITRASVGSPNAFNWFAWADSSSTDFYHNNASAGEASGTYFEYTATGGGGGPEGAVPEPSTIMLFGIGLGFVMGRRKHFSVLRNVLAH
ncbi:MAG: PEP-CTERM sorting domain-containing protein [Verrucomicrobia bacterium]|nr:PEP-CTERM sorting domain-containing protein [Verrucomicrobiota bacterium]